MIARRRSLSCFLRLNTVLKDKNYFRGMMRNQMTSPVSTPIWIKKGGNYFIIALEVSKFIMSFNISLRLYFGS